MYWSNVHIITISHIMHDTFSSHHANVFWREIQTCSDPNTLKMNHASNTSLHYLAMKSLFDYPSKNAHCIYVVFWWQNFLLPMHDSSLAAMQMGLAGNSKFTSLHFGISCWYPCKKVTWPVYYVVFWWQYAHRLTLCWDFALHLRSSLSHHLDPALHCDRNYQLLSKNNDIVLLFNQ